MSFQRPTAKFFEGQTPPKLPMFSQDNIDWYNEQIRRCREGFEFRGTRMTGDQYWFHNICPMPVLEKDPKTGKLTGEFGYNYPYWSQADDYVFKQIEEAEQAQLGFPLMTHRGAGKTQIILSIGGKIFFLKKAKERMVHGIISATNDDHALPTFMKFSQLVKGVNKYHPSLALDLIKDNTGEIIAGTQTNEDGKWNTELRAFMEKIVYGNSADKTRGRRVDYLMYEEIGAWSPTDGATLKDCIAANRGIMWLGGKKVCRDFYIGTGGNVLSDQAKEIMSDPESFELYPYVDYEGRKRGFTMYVQQKRHTMWEETGFCDEKKAIEEEEKIRAVKRANPDPEVYNKYVQEFPFNWEEMFRKGSGNRFNAEKIAERLTYLDIPGNRMGEFGDLEWVRDKDGKIIAVEWVPSNKGKMWMLEPPEINPETGRAYKRLYVGGYDGIDVGIKEKVTTGSSGSLCIKKRMLSAGRTNNTYVFWYIEKPKEIDDWFEGCLKACYFFNLVEALNIEDTKRGIVGFFRNNKFMKGSHFFMPRPRLTLPGSSDKKKNDSNLIGTTSDPKNYEHGENFLIRYINEYWKNMWFIPGLTDNKDFDMQNRTKHDPTVSMMMCELADDEFMDQPVERRKEIVENKRTWGYYTDSKGRKRYGEIPKAIEKKMKFQTQEQIPSEIRNGTIVYNGY